MTKRNKRVIPKRHKFELNSKVVFLHAGSYRAGVVTELTKEEPTGHATYTVVCSARGIIYPCLGLDRSKEHCVLTKETRITFS